MFGAGRAEQQAAALPRNSAASFRLGHIHAVEQGGHTPLACGLRRLAANLVLQTSLTK